MTDPREPEPPDLAALAKRFLDLWQEEMTQLAADPELAHSISRFLKALPPGLPFWPGFGERAEGGAGGADRAAAAAASSHERGQHLDEFASRLDAVEKRLARLEAGTRTGGGGARKKPKKRPA
ncbi:MAG: hypothetical protein ACREFD_12460 [Stellaceae bacterium]